MPTHPFPSAHLARPPRLGVCNISSTAAVLGAALLEAVKGEASRQQADGKRRFGGSEQGLKSFPCLSSSSHSTPSHHPAGRPVSTFLLPSLGSWVSLSVRCARAATSRSARAGESSSCRVLAVPPGSGSCPTRPHPRPAGCARNPSPGQCASSPAPRLRPGWLLPAKQAEVGRSGRPARGVRTLAGRTPPLSRVVPREGGSEEGRDRAWEGGGENEAREVSGAERGRCLPGKRF